MISYKRIAFINYSLFAGGAERNVINLSKIFIKNGLQTDIIIFKDINEYKYEYGYNLKNLHIIPLFKADKKILPLLKPFYAFVLFYRLFNVLRLNKYDLLIAAEEYDPFFITVFFSCLLRIKSLLLVGNNVSAELETKNFILRSVYKVLFFISFYFSTHIICVSKKLRIDLIENFSIQKNKITSIYNGVDVKMIKQKLKDGLTSKEKELFVKNKTVITMGRLVNKKGFEYLIRTFALVKKQVSGARLIIIGKGPLEKALMKLASDLKVKKDIIFTGFEKNNPYRLLKRADIFVFSSLYEGFGNVIIEAMNCGLPIVSMGCPYGPNEILEDGKWGVLVPQKNMNKCLLAGEMIRLLKNKSLLKKYKKLSLRRAKSFTLDIMGRKYLKIIHTMLKQL